MSRFIQLHLLTSYPPSNLNRDDSGRPKTAEYGNVRRLRISSQSLKRAWRTAPLFEEALAGHLGARTKELGRLELYPVLKEAGVADKTAREWVRTIVGQFGKMKPEAKADKKAEKKGKKGKAAAEANTGDTLDLALDSAPQASEETPEDNPKDDLQDTLEAKLKAELQTEQLVHFSPEELAAINALVKTCIARGTGPQEDELKLLRHPTQAVDIAMFGRMLADSPAYNVDAAVQVAHAVTVHRAAVEDDYFSAVDDLNDGQEDSGAAHIGERAYGAGLFYLYLCINRELLKENLGQDEALTQRALAALVETAAKISPTGMQNSHASRAYATYFLAEKGDQQPRSLTEAFLHPVTLGDKVSLEDNAISALNSRLDNFDKVYGPCADTRQVFRVATGEGSLADLLQFVQA